MSRYGVNEIFTSIQGEGFHTGRPATFIRLQGCTVGCPWCDSGPLADDLLGRHTNGFTRNTWSGRPWKVMTGEEIADLVDMPWVIITGGEPTLYDLDDVIDALRFRNEAVQIQLETSGQNVLKGRLTPNWVTWSPKENLKWDAPDDLKIFVDEVKWVVDDNLTLDTVSERMAWFYDTRAPNSYPHVILMPEGCPPSKEHIEKAIDWAKQSSIYRVMDRVQYRFNIR